MKVWVLFKERRLNYGGTFKELVDIFDSEDKANLVYKVLNPYDEYVDFKIEERDVL